MLKLNASFSKKVPAEQEYSSKSYHASIEVELPTGLTANQLKSKIHETFELVEASVENEINRTVVPVTDHKRQAPQREATKKATEKQIEYILNLGHRKMMALPQLNKLAHDTFGVESLHELTRCEASRIVDQLKEAA
jgi:hypothetical protein